MQAVLPRRLSFFIFRHDQKIVKMLNNSYCDKPRLFLNFFSKTIALVSIIQKER
jgi:hypothetical protein